MRFAKCGLVTTLLLPAMAFFASASGAQTGDSSAPSPRQLASTHLPGMSSIHGAVRDSLGHPIPYATVYYDGGHAATASEDGQFHLDNVPPGRTKFGVRRIGFAPVDFTMDMREELAVSVNVLLHQTVLQMRTITVEEKQASMYLNQVGFYERQHRGDGYFMIGDDLEERQAMYLEQFFFGVPGVTIQDNGKGELSALGNAPGGLCRMTVWLDGRVWRTEGDVGTKGLNPRDIKAVEIYPHIVQAPAEFHNPQNPQCGAIVLWTKID